MTKLGITAAILAVFTCNATASDWREFFHRGVQARKEGRYQDAQRDLVAALAEAHFDERDIRRAELEGLLANVANMLGETVKADRLYRESLGILEHYQRPDPNIQQLVLGDFGVFCIEQGRFKEAAAYLSKALATSRTEFGDGDPRTAVAKLGMGRLYLEQSRLSEAEEFLLAAAGVLDSVEPPDHNSRIACGIALGTLYAAEGRYTGALAILQRAAEEARQLGEMNPWYADVLAQLGGLYRIEGNQARSEPLLRKALAIYEASAGQDAPKVGYVLLLQSMNALTEKKSSIAESEVRRALAIFQKAGGADSRMSALAEYRLAEAMAQQGKNAEAEDLLKAALSIQERTYPNGHTVIADTLYDLAEVEVSQRHYTEAAWSYERAISIYEKADGPFCGNLSRALHRYARILRTNRTSEAKAMETRAQELARSAKAFK